MTRFSRLVYLAGSLLLCVPSAEAFDEPAWDVLFVNRDALQLDESGQEILVTALTAIAANFPESSIIDEDAREKALFLALKLDPLDTDARRVRNALVNGQEPEKTTFFTESVSEISETLWSAGDRMLGEDAEPAAGQLAQYVRELSIVIHPAPPRRRIENLLASHRTFPAPDWKRYLSLQPEKSPSTRKIERLMSAAAHPNSSSTHASAEPRIESAQSPRLMKSLVLHYAFDKDEGQEIRDRSGNNHDAIASGGRWYSDENQGGFFELSGQDDFIRAEQFQGIVGGNPRTVALWFKEIDSTSSGWGVPFIEWGTGRNNCKFKLGLGPGKGLFHVDVGQHAMIARSMGMTLQDKSWHHIAVSVPKDGAIGDVLIYLDGEPVAARPSTFNQSPKGPLNTGLGMPVTIGLKNVAGCVDEIMIWHRELSAKEIRTVFTNSKK